MIGVDDYLTSSTFSGGFQAGFFFTLSIFLAPLIGMTIAIIALKIISHASNKND